MSDGQVILTPEQRNHFHEQGHVVAPGLFSDEEVERYRDHYMKLRAADSYPGDFVAANTQSNDPLQRYPRLIHMHRWDRLSLEWLLEPRLDTCLTALLGRSPYAVQTMLYFKPPGARGQALHQDQFYLKVQPGTCMAAWLALDDCDEENGCLQVVPGTHNLPVLCTEKADLNQSFTDVTVPLREGMVTRPILMKAGDVLFFNGQLIHGSLPNTSSHRFRRALIGHYIVAEAEKVAQFYHPVLCMDGREATLGVSQGGNRCGVWVNVDGAPVVEMQEAT